MSQSITARTPQPQQASPQLASRVMKARRQSTCPLCQGPVRVGDLIAKTVKWAHAGCIIANRFYTQDGRQ
jgi:hypothetical protein